MQFTVGMDIYREKNLHISNCTNLKCIFHQKSYLNRIQFNHLRSGTVRIGCKTNGALDLSHIWTEIVRATTSNCIEKYNKSLPTLWRCTSIILIEDIFCVRHYLREQNSCVALYRSCRRSNFCWCSNCGGNIHLHY